MLSSSPTAYLGHVIHGMACLNFAAQRVISPTPLYIQRCVSSPGIYDDSDLTNAQDILFIVNVQHNCRDSRCEPSGRRRQRQECQETTIEIPFVEHTDDTHYILNMHALHNSALLRKALPRELTRPLPYLTDCTEQHQRMAASLRSAHDDRRKKEAQTRAARKEKQLTVKTRGGPHATQMTDDSSNLVVGHTLAPGAALVGEPSTPPLQGPDELSRDLMDMS